MTRKTVAGKANENRSEKDFQAQNTIRNKAAMMCWETLEGFMAEEPNKETSCQDERPDDDKEKPNYDEAQEEHANCTLHTGNQLKLLIKEFTSGMEENALILATQETSQKKLVYISNLKKDSQNNGIELNKEEGPEDKKPPAKNRPFERPSSINLNNESKVFKESGSENDNAEETKKEKNPKKMKRITYIEIDSDDDERHKKQHTKNMTEGNQVEVKGKIHSIRKRIIHYYDLTSEDDSKLSGEPAKLWKKKNPRMIMKNQEIKKK